MLAENKTIVFFYLFWTVSFTWLQGVPVSICHSFTFFPIHCSPGIHSRLANVLQTSPEVFFFNFGVFSNQTIYKFLLKPENSHINLSQYLKDTWNYWVYLKTRHCITLVRWNSCSDHPLFNTQQALWIHTILRRLHTVGLPLSHLGEQFVSSLR